MIHFKTLTWPQVRSNVLKPQNDKTGGSSRFHLGLIHLRFIAMSITFTICRGRAVRSVDLCVEGLRCHSVRITLTFDNDTCSTLWPYIKLYGQYVVHRVGTQYMQALQCYKLLKRKVECKLDDPKIFKFYMDFKFEYNRIMYIIIWLVY